MNGTYNVKLSYVNLPSILKNNGVRKDEVMSCASYSVDCYLQNIDRKIKHMANKRDTLTGIQLHTMKIQ